MYRSPGARTAGRPGRSNPFAFVIQPPHPPPAVHPAHGPRPTRDSSTSSARCPAVFPYTIRRRRHMRLSFVGACDTAHDAVRRTSVSWRVGRLSGRASNQATRQPSSQAAMPPCSHATINHATHASCRPVRAAQSKHRIHTLHPHSSSRPITPRPAARRPPRLSDSRDACTTARLRDRLWLSIAWYL
jgi:hypothetical protein